MEKMTVWLDTMVEGEERIQYLVEHHWLEQVMKAWATEDALGVYDQETYIKGRTDALMETIQEYSELDASVYQNLYELAKEQLAVLELRAIPI